MAHNTLTKFAGAMTVAFGMLFTDPFGLISVFGSFVWAQAATLFTVFSLAGFTFAPEIPQIPTRPVRLLAFFFGAIFLLTMLDKLSDALIDRLDHK